MTPLNFPKLTRTKTEALQFAAEIFPGEQTALARLKPGTTHPRYQLTHDTADTLRAILFWLHEQKPKIYKRARWHLFYDLARRAAAQLDENAQAKVRDLYAEDRAEVWQKHQAAQIMTGDGQGI
jgi:hypothetical protein